MYCTLASLADLLACLLNTCYTHCITSKTGQNLCNKCHQYHHNPECYPEKVKTLMEPFYGGPPKLQVVVCIPVHVCVCVEVVSDGRTGDKSDRLFIYTITMVISTYNLQ